MTDVKNTPKGKEEITAELLEEFGEIDETTLEKLVNRELKHQESLSTAIKQKKAHRTKAEELAKTIEGLDKEGKQPKDNLDIDMFDLQRYIARGGTRTGLRQIKYIMKAKECDFSTAVHSGLYKAWEKENEQHIKDIKSQLPPSRGGAPAPGKDAPLSDGDKKFLAGMGLDPSKVKKDK